MDPTELPTAASSLRQVAGWIIRHPLPTASALCVVGAFWVVDGWRDYRNPVPRVVARVRYPEPVLSKTTTTPPAAVAAVPVMIVPEAAPEPTPDEGGAIFSLGGE